MKIKAKVTPEHRERKTFNLLPEGIYHASIKEIKTDTFEGKYAGQPGKFTYLKIVMCLLINPGSKDAVELKFVDIMVGNINEDGELFRPDNDDSKPVIWSQAMYLFEALNMFDENGDLMFDTETLSQQYTERVMAVRVSVAGYQKSSRKSYTPDDITGMLGTATLDNAKTWSAEHAPDDPLRLKNVVIGTYALREDEYDDYFIDENNNIWDDETSYNMSLISGNDSW